MIKVLVELEGGLVRNVITDELGHQVQVIVVDKDKDQPLVITEMEAEVRKSIDNKKAEYILKDIYKRLGYNVVVSPDSNGENPMHTFTGTLVDVEENAVDDFYMIVEDQDSNRFTVDHDQVQFE